MTNKYPKNVKVRQENGTLEISYKKIIKHEELIIEDNIFYGYKTGCSKEEITKYQKRAYQELKELKKLIRKNPNVVLKLHETTERYIEDNEE